MGGYIKGSSLARDVLLIIRFHLAQCYFYALRSSIVSMKLTYLLGVLAYGLCLEARRIPAPGVFARQWGDGGDDDEGDEGGDGGGEAGDVCEWTDHCLGIFIPLFSTPQVVVN